MALHPRFFNKLIWPLSLFYSLLLIRGLFVSFSFELTDFDTLIPGVATFNLIDINERVRLFHNILLTLPILFIGLNIAINRIYRRIPNRTLFTFLNYTSLLGIGLFFLEYLTKVHETSVYFIVLLQLCFIVYLLLWKSDVSYRHFGYYFLTAYILSFVIRELEIIFFNISSVTPFSILVGVEFIVILLLVFFIKRKKDNPQNFMSIPMLIIPLLGFLSTELYLISNQRQLNFLSPNKLFFIGLVILIAFQAYKKKTLKNNDHFIYVLLIIGVATFSFYLPIVQQSTEMFELANPANSIMRMFLYNELPFIDFMNSHVVWEWIFKSIYVLFNGYSGSTDFVIYDFVDWVLFYIASWWLFKTFFNHKRYAFIAIIFIPFLPGIVYRTMYFAIFNLCFLLRLRRDFTLRNLLLNFGWIAFSLFWRLDSGIASAVASIIVLFIILLKRNTIETWLTFIKASLIFGSFALLIFISSYLIWKDHFIVAIKQSLSYFGAAQAHGLPTVSVSTNRYLYNSYFIFPFLVTGVGLVSIYHLFESKIEDKKNVNYLILMFLVIVYFVNIPRGLVRHSLISGDTFINSFFFLIVLLFIYQLINNKKHARWCFLVLSVFILPNFKYGGALGNENLFQKFDKSFNQANNIYKQNEKINRCVQNKTHNDKTNSEFVKFMNQNFNNSATFIDFSNTPMLYFYSNRNVPSYFCQYMQNTVNEYLQEENIKYLNNFDVPITVFLHIPANWWDATDGVPNTIRYNKIAQYIFENYKPLGNVNDYWIWVKRGVLIKDSTLVKPYQYQQEEYNLKYYPYALAKNQQIHAECFKRQSLTIKNDTILMPLQKDHSNEYLQLEITCSGQRQIEICYGDSATAGSFIFETTEKNSENLYSLPLCCQYEWVDNSFEQLWLNANKDVKLVAAEVITETYKIEDQ